MTRWFVVLLLVFQTGACLPIDRWTVRDLTPATADFSLRAEARDPNGLWLNPYWYPQGRDGALPPLSPRCEGDPARVFATGGAPCTGQRVRHDRAAFPTDLVCAVESSFAGHVNWTPVTVTGTASWLTWAAPWDNDVNFNFVPHDGAAGLTKGNGVIDGSTTPFIELEFTSDETLDKVSTPWWTGLWSRVQEWSRGQETDVEIRRWLNPANPAGLQRAVAIGLFGLDCEHDCRSEVHPVFALALETESTQTSSTWAILARNWGTEGFCASRLHYLDLPNREIRLLLPGRQAPAPGTRLTATFKEYATLHPATPDPTVELDQQGGGVIVTLPLPDADTHPLTELVLTLEWEGGSPGQPVVMPAPPLPKPLPPAVSPATRPIGPERRLATAAKKLDRAQSQAVASAIDARRSVVGGPGKTTIRPLPRPIRVEPRVDRRVIRPRVAVPKPATGEVKAWLQRRQDSQVALLKRMCDAHQGRLPGFTDEQSRIVCGGLAK